MHVLVIEDDEATAAYIKKGLLEAGHDVDMANRGDIGFEKASHSEYDALIVDRMLPGMEGLAIISKLRDMANNTPALILSALGEVDDRITGLRAGGDDYLTKPFSFSELMARIEALVRRSETEKQETTIEVGELEMDLLSREVRRSDKIINLQPREFRLLEYLMRHSNQVVTRTMLLENVWDYNFDPQTNVIDVHISRLRSKLDKGFDVPLLNTVRGAGYMLRDTSKEI